MIWTIIKKELSMNLFSFRFVLIFLLCCTLILVSAYTMRGKYEESMEEYVAAVAMHKEVLEEPKSWPAMERASVSGYTLDKPPTSLSVVVEGIEGAAGNYSTINILSAPKLEGGAGGDPMFAYFGTMDIMYIVRVVLSLVAILLTYDALSGEREQGTLKLALSNSVPRATVLLAKCVGGYITLLLPFLVPLLIGLLILTTSGSINFSGVDWARLGLILLASLLYIGVFLMLGLMVSSRTKRSSTALMVLLFVWVVIVLATPKVSMIVAGKMHDVPSVQEIQAVKDSIHTQMEAEWREKEDDFWGENRAKLRNPAIKKAVMDEYNKMREEAYTNINTEKKKIDIEYKIQKAAQFQLAARISRISPASVYTYASTTLARTGFDRQMRFLTAARTYQEGFVRYHNDLRTKMITRARVDQEAIDNMTFELDKLPALDFQEASFSDSWNSAIVDLLILFLLFACLFMIAYLGFMRSDIR